MARPHPRPSLCAPVVRDGRNLISPSRWVPSRLGYHRFGDRPIGEAEIAESSLIIGFGRAEEGRGHADLRHLPNLVV